MLDYEGIKNSLVSVVREYVYPQQLHYESSIDTSVYGTLRQGFYPFSTTISNIELYVKDIVGNPGNCNVALLDREGNTLTSNTITFSHGWNTLNLSKENLVSKWIHYLELKHDPDPNNYYVFGASTVNVFDNTLYSGKAETVRLAFKVDIGEKVSTVYRTSELKLDDYPIVVCDLSARPRVFQRYIDPKTIEEVVTAYFNIYSRYPSEVDKIARLIEKAMFRERLNVGGIFLISPSGIGGITRLRENIFNRAVTFNLRMLLRVE